MIVVGLPNSNIGVFDIESFEEDGVSKPYAIGFKTNQDYKCKTYYINKNLDSVELMHRCIDEMIRPKYYKTHFYVHNLGGYDAAFIIKNLVLFYETAKGKVNPYWFDENKTITRDSNILKLVIKRKVEGKVRTLTLLDSFAILPRSLRDLSMDYNIKYLKSHFPYLFCTRETLFYTGKKLLILIIIKISLKLIIVNYTEKYDLWKKRL